MILASAAWTCLLYTSRELQWQCYNKHQLKVSYMEEEQALVYRYGVENQPRPDETPLIYFAATEPVLSFEGDRDESVSYTHLDAIFQAGRTDLFERGEQVIQKVCRLQDDRPDSRTFGLWSYYMEEPLDSMIAPDYNWADFISKCLLDIRILAGERMSEETKAVSYTHLFQGIL